MSECAKIARQQMSAALVLSPLPLDAEINLAALSTSRITRCCARRMRGLRHKDSTWRDRVVKAPTAASFDFPATAMAIVSPKPGSVWKSVARFRNGRLRHMPEFMSKNLRAKAAYVARSPCLREFGPINARTGTCISFFLDFYFYLCESFRLCAESAV